MLILPIFSDPSKSLRVCRVNFREDEKKKKKEEEKFFGGCLIERERGKNNDEAHLGH